MAIVKATMEAEQASSSVPQANEGEWFLATQGSVDEGDTGWRGLVDASHAVALIKGNPVAGQMNTMNCDLELGIWPTSSPDDTETTAMYVQVDYYSPTKERVEALQDLLELEAWNDAMNTVTDPDAAAPEISPLLTVGIAEDVASDVNFLVDAFHTQLKGSNIVRWGFDGSTPLPYRVSSFTTNLNPSSDTDFSDPHETQYYVFSGDDLNHFGVFDRKEASLNGTETGETIIQQTWAYPMSSLVMGKPNNQRQVIQWGLDSSDPADPTISMGYRSLKFTNLDCLSGLIKVSILQVASLGELVDNNDFEVFANLTVNSIRQLE